MMRTDRVRWSELKVGLLVAFGLLFLLWASFSGGGTSIFYSKLELNTVLNTANGLIQGAPVRLSGVEVGKVGEIRLIGRSAEEQVHVQMEVERRVWSIIKQDSRATLGTIGMLGDKYIEISPGSVGLPDLQPGDYIEGHVAGDLLTIIDRAPDMLGNLDHLSSALGRLARRLEGTEGTLGRLVYSDSLYESLVSTTAEAGRLVRTLQSDLPALTEKAGTILDQVGELSDRAQDTAGTVGMLLASRHLYDRLDRITSRLDSLSAGLQAGEGTAGAVLKSDQMYDDLHKTVLDLQFLLRDIREHPKKYVTFKLF